jgi:hypothetical protein
MKIPCGKTAGYLNVRNFSLSYLLATSRSKLLGLHSLSVSIMEGYSILSHSRPDKVGTRFKIKLKYIMKKRSLLIEMAI